MYVEHGICMHWDHSFCFSSSTNLPHDPEIFMSPMPFQTYIQFQILSIYAIIFCRFTISPEILACSYTIWLTLRSFIAHKVHRCKTESLTHKSEYTLRVARISCMVTHIIVIEIAELWIDILNGNFLIWSSRDERKESWATLGLKMRPAAIDWWTAWLRRNVLAGYPRTPTETQGHRSLCP